MKRVYVYRNKIEKNGKALAVENSFEAFKLEICKQFKFNMESLKVYTENGCEINDLHVVKDEDKLFINLDNTEVFNKCDNIENKLTNLSLTENMEADKSKTVADWITLNVGGKHFMTSRSTLMAKEPLSMLARMFAEENNVYLMNPSTTDNKGAYLIDRSPEYFEPILNYLRHGEVILDKHVNPKGVLEEAVFYGMYYSLYI